MRNHTCGLLTIAVALFCGITLSGCLKENDVNEPTPVASTEIVTYIGETTEGTVFHMQSTENGRMRRLLDSRRLSIEDVSKGTRLLLDYITELNDTAKEPMPIRVQHLYRISFDTVKWMSRDEIMGLERPQARVISQWRTGDFVNLQFTLNYSGNATFFGIAAEKGSVSNPPVQLYLYRKGDVPDTQYVERRTLGSFFIDPKECPNDVPVDIITDY